MSTTGNFKLKMNTNPTTGEETKSYDLGARLLSIGASSLKNSNDKNYKIVKIEFEHPTKGNIEATAQLFEKSEDYGLTVGEVYLTNMSTDGEKTYFRMSHLVAGAGLADADLFDSIDEVVGTVVSVEA